jgi:diguanylate cyclase (GGDEF)-like protein/PAS domain S-box-containing protein
MTAVDTASNDAQARVETHPRLIELVRIAATLAHAEAEIVTLQNGWALVVSSLEGSPRRRPLTRTEREILSTQRSHTISVDGMSFAVCEEDGFIVAVLSIHGHPPTGAIGSLRGVARLVSELFQEAELTRGGLWEALVHGPLDVIMVPSEREIEQGLMLAVLDQLHDGIVTIDRIGSPTLVNQAARLMHGITGDQLAPTLSIDDLLVLSSDGRPVDRDSHPMTRASRGESFAGESMSLLREGLVRHVQVSGQPVLGPDGVQLGAVIGYRDVTSALHAQRELVERALQDQLTGLPNRRHLHEHFLAVRNRQFDRFVGVCFIDLDGFKLVNDTFGHRVGDTLVRDVAARLSAETDEDVFLARVGGDEFVAVLSHVSDESVALALAERFRKSLRRPFAVPGTDVTLSASIGLALQDMASFDEDVLLRRADIALYAAKARGRNRIELFNDDLAIAAQHEQRQHEILRNTLDRSGLVMHFQPLVDCHTDEIVGFEALARCRLSDGTLVGPSSFLDAAISSRLICELDRKAFALSCQAVSALRHRRPDRPIVMSCNFAALSIVQSNFVRDVLDTVERHGIQAADICIEITESTAFEAGDVAITALQELRGLGFLLALDDFGTGYSSLAHLRDLPLASVKVDRSFITRLGRGTSERVITEAVVNLAATLDLSVVAEGVETQEQLHQVRELGFRIVQGDYYSPALPLSEAMELL